MPSFTERLKPERYSAGLAGLIPTKPVALTYPKFEAENGRTLTVGNFICNLISTCNAGNPGVLDFAPRSGFNDAPTNITLSQFLSGTSSMQEVVESSRHKSAVVAVCRRHIASAK
jgi:hypothetical protein